MMIDRLDGVTRLPDKDGGSHRQEPHSLCSGSLAGTDEALICSSPALVRGEGVAPCYEGWAARSTVGPKTNIVEPETSRSRVSPWPFSSVG